MITLYVAYTNPTTYADSSDPALYGILWQEDRYEFDEVNEVVVHHVGPYDDYQNHNPPFDFSLSGSFFDSCLGTTHREYVHDGAGGFTLIETPNSLSCGYVPAQPPSCDVMLSYQLTPTLTGASVTATSAAGHGAVRYQLDGGAPQAGATFYDLPPGRHVLSALDTGVANCVRSVAFTVATPPPPAAPAGRAQGVDFVLQPLWYPCAAPASAEVVLELWAESQHQADDFSLVMRLRKRADASGRVYFRLDTLLAPLLRAMVPPRSALATVLCRTPLLNYFVRTATVPGPGVPTRFVTSPLRTALRGGLPADRRDIDYFTYRLEATGQPPFLSWQPAAKSLTAEQPEWLFWLCPDQEPTLLTVRRSYVRTGFAEGLPVVEEETVSLASARGPFGRLLAIPVRPRSGIDAVSLALYDPAGEALSPLVSYEMVAATPRSRYLHFTNSLGGFDTLRTEGRLDASLEATAERYELPATPGGAAPAPERQTFAVAATRKLKLATGWLSAAQLAWLQELVLAREIWEQKNGRLLPLDPARRKLDYEADDTPLRGMLLEFDYAYEATAYSTLP